MKVSNREVGKLGEDIAAGYLKKNGYKIVERNVVLENGELDIVCEIEGILVLVEVRTKRPVFFYLPEETVGFLKLSRLLNLADEYCQKIEYTGVCRIDVIGVCLSRNSKNATLRHYAGVV